MPNMQADQGQEENQELRAQLAASQARVVSLETTLFQSDVVKLRETIATLQATLAEREARTKELEEWQKIVIGSGTDQETVIRMAANEYTKSAVQCWKEHTKKIEADLDLARQDAARLREALRFYADPHTYGLNGGTNERIIKDRGQQAQRALKGA